MRRAVLILMGFLMFAPPVLAQGDCGNGLPCGPIPWPLPQLPPLQSPTPFETAVYSATETPEGPTPTPSLTPTPSNTPEPTQAIDLDPLQEAVGTFQGILELTQEVVPGDIGDMGDTLSGDASNLFGYIRGLQSIHLGVLNPLLAFLFFSFSVVLLVKVSQFILPVAGVIFGFIRKIIQLVAEIIPG